MTIRCKCEHCGVSLKVKDELAGKQKPCPQCKEMISIPNPDQESAKKPAVTKSPAGPEEDFPYFDDIPVRPPLVGSPSSPEFSSPLEGGGGTDVYDDPYAPPSRRSESKISGSAAGIAGELLRKIESTDRKNRGSGAANKKKRKIFGDVEGDMTTSETSAKDSLMMVLQGFVLPIAGVCVVVFLAWYASNYFMGDHLKLPPLGRVYGTIKIDGNPIRNARIEFHPAVAEKLSGGENLATSMAISDGNGNFEVYYGSGIRGAVIGKHLIMISAQDAQGHELVPPDWNSATTQTVDVKSGSNKVNFEIQTIGLGDPTAPADPNLPVDPNAPPVSQ